MRARRKQLIKNQFWINLEDPNLGGKKIKSYNSLKMKLKPLSFFYPVDAFQKVKSFFILNKISALCGKDKDSNESVLLPVRTSVSSG